MEGTRFQNHNQDARSDGQKDVDIRIMKTHIMLTMSATTITSMVFLAETRNCVIVQKQHTVDQDPGHVEIIVLPEKVVPVLQDLELAVYTGMTKTTPMQIQKMVFFQMEPLIGTQEYTSVADLMALPTLELDYQQVSPSICTSTHHQYASVYVE